MSTEVITREMMGETKSHSLILDVFSLFWFVYLCFVLFLFFWRELTHITWCLGNFNAGFLELNSYNDDSSTEDVTRTVTLIWPYRWKQQLINRASLRFWCPFYRSPFPFSLTFRFLFFFYRHVFWQSFAQGPKFCVNAKGSLRKSFGGKHRIG